MITISYPYQVYRMGSRKKALHGVLYDNIFLVRSISKAYSLVFPPVLGHIPFHRFCTLNILFSNLEFVMRKFKKYKRKHEYNCMYSLPFKKKKLYIFTLLERYTLFQKVKPKMSDVLCERRERAFDQRKAQSVDKISMLVTLL